MVTILLWANVTRFCSTDEAQTATVSQFFRSQLAAIDAGDMATSKYEGESSDAATSEKIDDVELPSHTNMPTEEVCVAA